jgi:hypothetical protein
MGFSTSNLRLIIRVGGILTAITLVAWVAPEAWACPTCKEDLASNPNARGLASGFYYSILLMMSMPFVIVGMLGTVFYRSVRRAQGEMQAATPDDAAPQNDSAS